MRPSPASAIVSGSSGSLGSAVAAVFGSSICTPTVRRGAASMKMIRSTSITSTKGVTLISDIGRDARRRRRLPSPRITPVPMSGRLVELPRQDQGEFVGEALVHADNRLGLAVELVVEDHRRDRGEKAEAGRKQRLGDARRHHREVGRLLEGDLLEGVLDAPDRAEEADEGGGRAD